MEYFTYLVLLCLLVNCSVIWSISTYKRIIGGKPINIEEVPYIMQVLSIKGKKIVDCGGSLIKPSFVVTAAHCLEMKPDKVIVYGGATHWADQKDQRSERTVVHYVIHPHYQSERTFMDVAVLKLDAPMTGANIKTIKLCKSWHEGDMLQVSGWGTTEDGVPSKVLRSVEIPIDNGDKCERLTQNRKGVLCAGTNGKDAHVGDSGGPAVSVKDKRLVGIVSFGSDEFVGQLGAYTDVCFSEIKDFIKECLKM